MKNKELIIVNIIILSIVVIGLIFVLFSCINNKFNFFNISNRSKTKIYDETYDVKEISDIEISSDCGDVKIQETSDENIKVVVYGENKDSLKVNLYNEKDLKIDYSEKRRLSFFGINSSISYTVVYIPSTYDRNISIDVKYGDIEIDDFENTTMDINNDCGDINIGKVKDLKVKSSYGDIEVKSVLNKLNIRSNCGDIEVDNIQLLENSSIKSDLGDIKIGTTNDICIDTKVSLGDCKVNNSNRNSEIVLSIENNCGDIKVNN